MGQVDADDSSDVVDEPQSKALGFACAVAVGLFNGSLMAPLHYFQKQQPADTPALACACEQRAHRPGDGRC